MKTVTFRSVSTGTIENYIKGSLAGRQAIETGSRAQMIKAAKIMGYSAQEILEAEAWEQAQLER